MQSRAKHLLNLSLLCALSIAFFVVDYFLPKPIPFMKYGIANMFPLLLIVRAQYKYATLVMLFKIVFGNFFMGRLLSPVFFLSLFGGLFAIISAIALHQFLAQNLSIIAYSTIAAFSHLLGQLTALKIFILPETNILFFYKIFWIPTLISAIIIGYAIQKVFELNAFKL